MDPKKQTEVLEEDDEFEEFENGLKKKTILKICSLIFFLNSRFLA